MAAAGGRVVVVLKNLWALAPLAGLAAYVLARWRTATSMWAGSASEPELSGDAIRESAIHADEEATGTAHAREGGGEEARTLLGRQFARAAPAATLAPPPV